MWAGERMTVVGFDATTASIGKAITAAGTAHTKGSWVELTASSPVRADSLYLMHGGPANSTDFLVDLGIGGAGSEQVIIENIPSSCVSLARMTYPFRLPLSIPAGTRIAARCQAGVNSNLTRLLLGLIENGQPGFQRCTTYGANTADTGGTQVDPGASLNTKGSYAQIVASTSHDHKAILVGFACRLNATKSTGSFRVDLAIGGAGSEQIVIGDMALTTQTVSDVFNPQMHGPFFTHIPAGTRLAARAMADFNDATDRLLDIIVFGFD